MQIKKSSVKKIIGLVVALLAFFCAFFSLKYSVESKFSSAQVFQIPSGIPLLKEYLHGSSYLTLEPEFAIFNPLSAELILNNVHLKNSTRETLLSCETITLHNSYNYLFFNKLNISANNVKFKNENVINNLPMFDLSLLFSMENNMKNINLTEFTIEARDYFLSKTSLTLTEFNYENWQKLMAKEPYVETDSKAFHPLKFVSQMLLAKNILDELKLASFSFTLDMQPKGEEFYRTYLPAQQAMAFLIEKIQENSKQNIQVMSKYVEDLNKFSLNPKYLKLELLPQNPLPVMKLLKTSLPTLGLSLATNPKQL